MAKLLKFSLFFIVLLCGCKVVDEIKKEIYVKISTDDVTNVTYTGAILGGSVTDDGGKVITEKGICYSTNPGPNINNNKKNLGAGLGIFSVVLNNLTENTTYYYRTYCINALGTAYGEEKKFTTLDYSLPTITLSAPTNIVFYGMSLSANISSGGGTEVLEKGFVYSTSPNPTILNNKLIITGFTGNNTNLYNTNLTNLLENTQYYVRGFASNKKGVSYSNEILAKTLETEVPKIQTSVSGATTSTMNATASISNQNNIAQILTSGFYYSTNIGLKETDKFVLANYNGLGAFSSNIDNLLDGTVYYVRAFVKTSKGLTLGNEVQLTTLVNPIKLGLSLGLQVFYPFTGNANDASGKNYNGITSGVTLTDNRFNQPNAAYLFKGASKIVTNYFGIAGYNSRTISLWFKIAPNTIGNHSHVLSYGGNPFLNENIFSIFVSSLGSPKPYIGLLSNGYVGTQFNSLQDNQWHHLVVTVDNINLGKLTSTKMYLDGIYFSYDVFYYSSDINTKINLPLTIGQFTSLDSDPRNFGGSLDDIGIWNRVLTDTEIQYLYQNNYKP